MAQSRLLGTRVAHSSTFQAWYQASPRVRRRHHLISSTLRATATLNTTTRRQWPLTIVWVWWIITILHTPSHLDLVPVLQTTGSMHPRAANKWMMKVSKWTCSPLQGARIGWALVSKELDRPTEQVDRAALPTIATSDHLALVNQWQQVLIDIRDEALTRTLLCSRILIKVTTKVIKFKSNNIKYTNPIMVSIIHKIHCKSSSPDKEMSIPHIIQVLRKLLASTESNTQNVSR